MSADPGLAPYDDPLAPLPPLDEQDLRARLQKRLDETLQRQCALLSGISEQLAPLGDALVDLLRGGKRLRAAFCYWGWRGAGAPDGDEIVAAASALELLHACALVHDDVMDASDLRRGMPAAHRRFATEHAARGWAGSPEQFGVGAAILLGDLALSWADEALFASGLPPAALLSAKPVFDEMRTELMAGQYLDLVEQVGHVHGDASLERVLRVVRYKAAKYTVERPLQLGGTLAGAAPELLECYTAYGLPLGEAFQLRDDVLGVFGDPRTTGKPAGDDLREGKRTALVAAALDRATPGQAGVVFRLLGDPQLDGYGVDALRQVLSDTGALAYVEALIRERTEQAVTALSTCPSIEPVARDLLCRLAVAATTRSE